ncbi:MAG: protein kinase [Oscillospiraceae bacterium]|jgi:hypothetical protein|nr:protein kinase [Oscillospiraceae bacterium]
MTRCNSCFALRGEEFDVCPHCGYVQGAPAKELYHLYPGMRLNGRYIVGQVLGFGGFGITYKVWDTRMEAVLAVKEYYPNGLVNRTPGTADVRLVARGHQADFAHGLERFLDEARSMARFSAHPSIIHVFDFFEENGTAYFVMEYLDGINLNEYLRGNDMETEAAAGIVERVCDALRDIHAAGIVHRDVSPDNIFLCAGGSVKLIDFGAARFSSGEAALHTIILKPGFAPPEQYESISKQGPWTDIYALGATFYFMLTGVKPEESSNRKISDDLAPPNALRPEIPAYLSNTVMKAMAVDMHLRFQSVADFQQALRREKKVLLPAQEKKRRGRRRLAGVLAAALAVTLAGGIFFAGWNRERVAETLPDAAISLWLPGGEAQEQAVRDVLETFRASFPNVTVTVSLFPEADYGPALAAAAADGNLPALFSSDGAGADVLAKAAPLDAVFAQISTSDVQFLPENSAALLAQKQLPLGFCAPAVYEHPGASGAGAAKEDFLSGQTAEFRGSTADYADVQAALPAQFLLHPPDGEAPLARFGVYWSIGSCKGGELRCAERLLRFFLSSNAQDRLLIQSSGGWVPVNKKALGLFCEVYPDFDGFFQGSGHYLFDLNT